MSVVDRGGYMCLPVGTRVEYSFADGSAPEWRGTVVDRPPFEEGVYYTALPNGGMEYEGVFYCAVNPDYGAGAPPDHYPLHRLTVIGFEDQPADCGDELTGEEGDAEDDDQLSFAALMEELPGE